MTFSIPELIIVYHADNDQQQPCLPARGMGCDVTPNTFHRIT